MSFLDRIMNNKSVLITVVVVFSVCSVGYGDPWPGSGDANDPYQIHVYIDEHG